MVQITNDQAPNINRMTNSQLTTSKTFDLDARTEAFAFDCRQYIKLTLKTVASIEDTKQLARSSGSVAANYIEANEALSLKDLHHRIKICRKEVKESRVWLRLLASTVSDPDLARDLIDESLQLIKIFSTVLDKTNHKSFKH